MKNTFVKLKHRNIEIEHILEMVQEVEKENYELKDWFPRPGLKEKKSDFVSRLYIGQNFDEKLFDIVEKGWTHDHCEICFNSIGEEDNGYTENSGYFDGYDWICKSCFEDLVLAPDLQTKLDSIEKHFE